MSDNLYQIMRNSETLASYRAWQKETNAKGRPITIVGVVAMLAGMALFFASLNTHPMFTGGACAALLSVGSGSTMLGLGLIGRYRKLHPWKPF